MKDRTQKVFMGVFALACCALLMVSHAMATPAIGIPFYVECEKGVVKVIIQKPDICSKRLAEYTSCQKEKYVNCEMHRRAVKSACK